MSLKNTLNPNKKSVKSYCLYYANKIFGNLKFRFRKIISCRKNLEMPKNFSVISANVRNSGQKKEVSMPNYTQRRTQDMVSSVELCNKHFYGKALPQADIFSGSLSKKSTKKFQDTKLRQNLILANKKDNIFHIETSPALSRCRARDRSVLLNFKKEAHAIASWTIPSCHMKAAKTARTHSATRGETDFGLF